MSTSAWAVGKWPFYVAAPVDALVGVIPWSGVSQVWSEVANQPVQETVASAITGQISPTQAQSAQTQLTQALQQQGATPQQVQQNLDALNKYIQTPVAQGGAGGVSPGLGALALDVLPSGSSIVGTLLVLAVAGIVLYEVVK